MNAMTLSSAQVAQYLQRIGVRGPVTPNLETLVRLHAAHLVSVPFENLDIVPARRPIDLEIGALFDKIVSRRRGGFCYELNLLFATLLRSIGFPVRILSARVRCANGGFGPEFDHMTLLVELDELRLADVGYGEGFREPLRLEPEAVQEQAFAAYRLLRRGVDRPTCLTDFLLRPRRRSPLRRFSRRRGLRRASSTPRSRLGRSAALTSVSTVSRRNSVRHAAWQLDSRLPERSWRTEYLFTLKPRRPEDFRAMCRYHQTSPDSVFTRNPVCSRATPTGRVTITGDRLILTHRGRRSESTIAGEAELAALLSEHFGIRLDQEEPCAP